MADETTDNGGSLGDRSGVSGCGSGDGVRLPQELLVEARAHGVHDLPPMPLQIAKQLSTSIDENRAAKAKAALDRSLAHVTQLALTAAARPKPQPDPDREARAQDVRNIILNKVASLGWGGMRA